MEGPGVEYRGGRGGEGAGIVQPFRSTCFRRSNINCNLASMRKDLASALRQDLVRFKSRNVKGEVIRGTFGVERVSRFALFFCLENCSSFDTLN